MAGKKGRRGEAGNDDMRAAVEPLASVDSAEAAAVSAIAERRRKRALGKRIRIVAVVAVAVIAAAYLGGAAWFSSHFAPNSQVGSYDVSGLSVDEAQGLLGDGSQEYELAVTGKGLDFDVTADDAGLRLDGQAVAEAAIARNDPWRWPLLAVGAASQDFTDAMQVTYDEDRLSDLVKSEVKKANKGATSPKSATIAYDADAGAFVVVPEQAGTKLDSGAVLSAVEDAALAMQPSVQIGDAQLEKAKLLAGDEKLEEARTAADELLTADFELTLGGLDWLEVDKDLIGTWVTVDDDDVKATIDESAVRDWAGAEVGDVNSIGSKRTFKTPKGTKVSVKGGSYGWQVDYEPFVTALLEAVNSHSTEDLAVPCVQTAASIPDDGGVDFGDKYVEVNLKKQHAIFYDGDDVLWESDFISGTPDGEHETPTGVYMVNLKESPSKLVGEMMPVETTTGSGKKQKTVVTYEPEYETQVEYWMPFVGNAVGFHDATWQPDFGGTMYKEGYGSHGCINLPLDAAKKLYKTIDTGTPVIVHK